MSFLAIVLHKTVPRYEVVLLAEVLQETVPLYKVENVACADLMIMMKRILFLIVEPNVLLTLSRIRYGILTLIFDHFLIFFRPCTFLITNDV